MTHHPPTMVQDHLLTVDLPTVVQCPTVNQPPTIKQEDHLLLMGGPLTVELSSSMTHHPPTMVQDHLLTVDLPTVVQCPTVNQPPTIKQEDHLLLMGGPLTVELSSNTMVQGHLLTVDLPTVVQCPINQPPTVEVIKQTHTIPTKAMVKAMVKATVRATVKATVKATVTVNWLHRGKLQKKIKK